MVYRSAGNIEAMMSAATGDKIAHQMKVLEEYAIESSIAKVYGSEMLDFVVDEAVQIFGGYGFHEEYPVCRAYRDSRINRIFEGTNEINRMLIIQMLMKRAMGGQLPLIPAAMKLADEILAGPSFEEAPEGVLAAESRVVANAKKMFLQAAGGAVQKFREKLADEQELIGALSNIVMEIYAMESSLLRAQKAAAAKGESASQTMIDTARVFINDAAERVEREARRAIAAIHEGDMLATQTAVLKRFASARPWTPLRCAAALLLPCRRRTATPSKAANSAKTESWSESTFGYSCTVPYLAGHVRRRIVLRALEFPPKIDLGN